MAVPGSNFSDEQIDQQISSRQGQIRPETLLQATPTETDHPSIGHENECSPTATINILSGAGHHHHHHQQQQQQQQHQHQDQQESSDQDQSLAQPPPPLINTKLNNFELSLDTILNDVQSMDTVIKLRTTLSILDNHLGHHDNGKHYNLADSLLHEQNNDSKEFITEILQQNDDLKTDLKYMIDKYNQTLCLTKKAVTQLNMIMNGIRSQKAFQIDDLWSLIMSNNDSEQNKFCEELIVHSIHESCPVKCCSPTLDNCHPEPDLFINFDNSSISPPSDDIVLNHRQSTVSNQQEQQEHQNQHHQHHNHHHHHHHHHHLPPSPPRQRQQQSSSSLNPKKSLIRSSSAVQKSPTADDSRHDSSPMIHHQRSPQIVTTEFDDYKPIKLSGTKPIVYHHSSVTNLNRTTRTGGGSAASLASPSGLNDCQHGNGNVMFNNYEISQQLIDKQIGAIERSYGGTIARHAAYTIQRAYRSYRLRKRFTSLAMQAITQKKMLTAGRQQNPATDGNRIESIEIVSNSGDDTDNQTTTDIDNSQSKGSPSSSALGLSNSAMNAPVSNSSSSSLAAAAAAGTGTGPASSIVSGVQSPSLTVGDITGRMDTLQVCNSSDDQRPMSLSPIDRAAMQNRFSRKLSANFALEDVRLQGIAGVQQQHQQYHHQQQPQQQQQRRSMSIHPLGSSTNRDFYTIPRQGSPPIVVPVAYESVYNTLNSASGMYHHHHHNNNNNNNNASGVLVVNSANNGQATVVSSSTAAAAAVGRNLIRSELVTPKKTPSFSSTSSTGSGSTGSLHAGWSSNTSKHHHTTHSHTIPGSLDNRNVAVRSNSRHFVSGGVGGSSQDKKILGSANSSVTNLANSSIVTPVMTVNRPIPLTLSGGNQVTFAPNVSEVSSNHSEPANSSEDAARKRRYRVGLNLFNKSPSERGIQFLIDNGFIERFDSPDQQAKTVAQFLHTRKGMSRQMIGEYISENKDFNKLVLKHFCLAIDFSGTIVDEALRYFQSFFRFPGEAQKIERLVDAFADRYKECNPSDVLSRDSVFILAFAIIMLNTDLHKPTNIRHRMTPEQWLANLKGVFMEGDLSNKFLMDIYKRIKRQELVTGTDHVTQVIKVQSTITGRDVPNFALPHRRLVCYCSLYEIRDLNKAQKPGLHQRDIFLFNDLLLITKATNRTRNGTMTEYSYRSSTPLDGLQVLCFSTQFHYNGVRITRRVDNKLIACFNARNDLDQQRFVDDLQEAINEMDEMEQLRIQKSNSMVQLANPSNNHHRVNALESVGHFGTVSQLSSDNARRQIYHTAV